MPMRWRVCRRLPDGHTIPDRHGDRICWTIPFEPPPLTVPPGELEPPFMTHPNLTPADVRHLQVLATIDRLAEALPDGMSSQLHDVVASRMRDFGTRLGELELTRHSFKG